MPSDTHTSRSPHSRLLLWEVLLGPLLSLSTVVVFSVTSTLDGEREGESGGWGRVSELGGALKWPPPPTVLRCRLWLTQRAGVPKGQLITRVINKMPGGQKDTTGTNGSVGKGRGAYPGHGEIP